VPGRRPADRAGTDAGCGGSGRTRGDRHHRDPDRRAQVELRKAREPSRPGPEADPAHRSPDWPVGYWPDGDAPPDDTAWDRAVAAYRADNGAMRALVADPATDLFAPLQHGTGQTVLREALLVADHAAYHLGQMVVVRRLLRCWPEDG